MSQENTALFVTGLPRIEEFTEHDLESLLRESGFAPERINLHRSMKGFPKGTAIVKFASREAAQSCLDGYRKAASLQKYKKRLRMQWAKNTRGGAQRKRRADGEVRETARAPRLHMRDLSAALPQLILTFLDITELGRMQCTCKWFRESEVVLNHVKARIAAKMQNPFRNDRDERGTAPTNFSLAQLAAVRNSVLYVGGQPDLDAALQTALGEHTLPFGPQTSHAKRLWYFMAAERLIVPWAIQHKVVRAALKCITVQGRRFVVFDSRGRFVLKMQYFNPVTAAGDEDEDGEEEDDEDIEGAEEDNDAWDGLQGPHAGRQHASDELVADASLSPDHRFLVTVYRERGVAAGRRSRLEWSYHADTAAHGWRCRLESGRLKNFPGEPVAVPAFIPLENAVRVTAQTPCLPAHLVGGAFETAPPALPQQSEYFHVDLLEDLVPLSSVQSHHSELLAALHSSGASQWTLEAPRPTASSIVEYLDQAQSSPRLFLLRVHDKEAPCGFEIAVGSFEKGCCSDLLLPLRPREQLAWEFRCDTCTFDQRPPSAAGPMRLIRLALTEANQTLFLVFQHGPKHHRSVRLERIARTKSGGSRLAKMYAAKAARRRPLGAEQSGVTPLPQTAERQGWVFVPEGQCLFPPQRGGGSASESSR